MERLCLELSHSGESSISPIQCGQLRTPLCSLSKETSDLCLKKNEIWSNEKSEMEQVIQDLFHQLQEPGEETILSCPPLYENIGQGCFLHFSFMKVKMEDFCRTTKSMISTFSGLLGRSERILSSIGSTISLS